MPNSLGLGFCVRKLQWFLAILVLLWNVYFCFYEMCTFAYICSCTPFLILFLVFQFFHSCIISYTIGYPLPHWCVEVSVSFPDGSIGGWLIEFFWEELVISCCAPQMGCFMWCWGTQFGLAFLWEVGLISYKYDHYRLFDFSQLVGIHFSAFGEQG